MFLWCQNNINGILFLFVSHSDVESHVTKLKFEEYENWSTFPGMRRYHWCDHTSITGMFIQVYPLLTRAQPTRNKFKKTNVNTSDCLSGIYIACIFNDSWFTENATEMKSHQKEILMKFVYHYGKIWKNQV